MLESDMNKPAPITPAMADRLHAAEEDTGVKLGDRVSVVGTNHGVMSVVGFARINVMGIEGPIRCVCVADPAHLQQQGTETVMVFTPDKLRVVPALPAGQAN